MPAVPTSEPDLLPIEERRVREFFAARGEDLDALAIPYFLWLASSSVWSATDALALKSLGITPAGYTIMVYIWILGPQETRSLAKLASRSKASVVTIVDTLQASGLVRRCISAEDRRLVSIELTAEGRSVVEEAHCKHHQAVTRLTEELTPAERPTLVDLLRRLSVRARLVVESGK